MTSNKGHLSNTDIALKNLVLQRITEINVISKLT